MMSLSHLFYTTIFKSKKTMKNIYTSVKKLVIHNYLRRPQPSRMTSSFFNSVTFHRHSLTPNANPNPNRHTQTLQFSTKSTLNNNDTNGDTTAVTTNQPPLSPAPEKRTFAMATGELFLGLAAKLIKSSNGGEGDVEGQKVRMFSDEMRYVKKDNYFWNMLRRSKEVEVEEEEIGVVVDDGDVVWEQRLKDVEAERGRKKVTSPGFSFSAAGLLFPYHLGVAKFLIENGYIKDTTPLAGSSAGAIVCAVVASGATMEEALQATKVLAEDCRSRGTAFRLGAVLREVLEQFLPEDAHIRSNGRVRVAVTQILWRPRGLLVDQFDSREDLINAVITSSFIPGYLAPRPAILFRNRLCVDGGLTLFMPPTSAARTICVCAFPAGRLGLEDIGISPDCNPDNRASPRELFNWALEPAADSILDNLFELGYMDAAVWAELNPVKDLVQEDNPLVRQ